MHSPLSRQQGREGVSAGELDDWNEKVDLEGQGVKIFDELVILFFVVYLVLLLAPHLSGHRAGAHRNDHGLGVLLVVAEDLCGDVSRSHLVDHLSKLLVYYGFV